MTKTIWLVFRAAISPYSGKPSLETYGVFSVYENAQKRLEELKNQDYRDVNITEVYVRD